jgi:RNA polymerase sigma-70 factor (ECF subfamily)
VTDDRTELEARIRAAATAARWSDAITVALQGYGDELLGYLVAVLRNETDAGDAFAILAEDAWRGLPRFRWECTFRTWAYGLARHAMGRIRRDPHRRRAAPLEDAPLSALIEQVRSRTATFLRTETKDKIAELRAQLDPDDQSLLILRLNRGLPWRDIARVLAPEGGDTSNAALDRQSAALRKRFERLKTELKERARGAS